MISCILKHCYDTALRYAAQVGRPKQHGETTRAQLLSAAGRVLAQEGAVALSLRRVAEEVGTTTRAIYSLFGSKEGLLSAMYDELAEAFGRAHDAVASRSDVLTELLELALAYRRTALAHPNLYPLVVGPAVPGYTPGPDRIERARKGLRRAIEAIERGLEGGTFGGRDANTIAHMLWALLHGLTTLELAGAFGSRRRGEAMWRDAVSSLLSSLG